MTTAEQAAPATAQPHDPLDDPEIAAKVAEYLEKPYTITMVRDDSPGGPPAWVVRVEELRGCISQGDTPEEALTMIREAMELWIGSAVEHGDPIPPPTDHLREYDGRFGVRVPAGLHERLAREAKAQDVSLNQLVTAILAEGVGWRPARERD